MPRSRSRTRSLSPYTRRQQLSRRRKKSPRSRSPSSIARNDFAPTPPRGDSPGREALRRGDSDDKDPAYDERYRRRDNRYRDRDDRRQRRRYSESPPSRQRESERSPTGHNERDRPTISGGGGFRWKEKTRYDDRHESDGRRLERGYRDHDVLGMRERQPTQAEQRRDDVGDKAGSAEDRRRKDDIEDKFGAPVSKVANGTTNKLEEKPKKEKRDKKKKTAVASTGEQTIVVSVNDRLGTKTQVQCLPSDPIRMFKKIVAMNIGRQPHEIMLKRQGERPFKDQLTLEDYGVSNGVQLDLEIDTGD